MFKGVTEKGVNVMKKKIAIIIVAVVICAATAVFVVPKISYYACEPTVYFDVEGCDKVDTKMSAEDAETVKKMFEGKSEYFDSPSCGFDEKASIRIGCNTYMPACDGDETIKHGFMYFEISKSENKELRKIMKKVRSRYEKSDLKTVDRRISVC